MIGGAIYIAWPVGAMALVPSVIALMIAGQIHRHHRFGKIIGICHAAWLPVPPLMCLRLSGGGEDGAFLLWLGYSVAVMFISSSSSSATPMA